jgi:hypothetical protein
MSRSALRDVRIRGKPRGVFAAVFALALMLRILVPAGFMPAESTQGIVIRICSGMDEARAVVLDLHRSEDGKRHPYHPGAHGTCAFAALFGPATVPDPPHAILSSAMAPGEHVLPPPLQFNLPIPDYLTPPLRGPPIPA